MAGKYGTIASAKPALKGGQWFKPGKYRVRITGVKDQPSQKGGKDYTIIETVVLESNNPEIAVGSIRSQVIDMTNVMGMPNVKAFLAAASGVDSTLESVNTDIEAYWRNQDPAGTQWDLEKIIEQLVIRDNLLADVEMDLECVNVKTQEGGDFTKHNWETRDVSE